MATFEPYLLDLRDATLDLGEPGIRVIDAKTQEHVASVLPDDRGFYDAHAGKVLAEIINQRR
jgi:hypothetical protein